MGLGFVGGGAECIAVLPRHRYHRSSIRVVQDLAELLVLSTVEILIEL